MHTLNPKPKPRSIFDPAPTGTIELHPKLNPLHFSSTNPGTGQATDAALPRGADGGRQVHEPSIALGCLGPKSSVQTTGRKKAQTPHDTRLTP